VHFKDEVHDIVADLVAGTSSKKYTRQLIDKFPTIVAPDQPLSPEQLEAAREKLTLLTAYSTSAKHSKPSVLQRITPSGNTPRLNCIDTRLPAKARTAFLMAERGGMTYRQIADAMGCSNTKRVLAAARPAP